MEKYGGSNEDHIRTELKPAPGVAPMQIDIGDKPSDVGSYEFLGETFFIDDQLIEPWIVKRIQEFEPTYVPLRCHRRHKTPAGTEISVDYHVLGRYIEEPKEGYENAAVKLAHIPRDFKLDPTKIHALRTYWVPFKGPNWDGEGSPPDPGWLINAPPDPVKIGPWIIEQLRALRKFFEIGVRLETGEDGELHQMGTTDFTVDKLQEILDTEMNRDEKRMQEAIGEARYRARHNWRWLKQAADEERWTPEPPDDAKPFIDLGGSNGNSNRRE